MFISVTRLRIRSLRFLPNFAVMTWRALQQVRGAAGFEGGAVLNDRQWAFWTLTAWDNEASMRSYMTTGDHRRAMPRLLDWTDQASVVHWVQSSRDLPSWHEAARRMRTEGRPSAVRFPAPGHADLTFREPRVTLSGPIRRRRP